MTLERALAAIRALSDDVLVSNMNRLAAEADAFNVADLPIPQGTRDLLAALRDEYRARTGEII